MNRFRTKKRAKDDLAAGRSSEESEQSSLSFFRKGGGKKVQQEEIKKEFDLSSALPTNDDFRTSLLMNNLSARFSMLREQDDPNSKIGKASDDSVLYPKRQSRMADFGFGPNGGGLSDIAEVESVRGNNFLRTTSVGSDDPDSAAARSVLDRARPVEGNNLFGGRQKIFKIPASSGQGMSGRALYEDDVATSAFQRWRQTERERALNGLSGAGSDGADGEDGQPRSESPPPVGYNRKRETSSTTSSASVVGRNSTAATSVTSQAANGAKDGQSTPASAITSPIPERNVTRTRRLYEQATTKDATEQQGSALSRMETLTRPRLFGARTPEPPANHAFQADGSRTVQTKTSAPSLRSMSPPAVNRSIGVLDSAVKPNSKPGNSGSLPLSPAVSDTAEQPTLSILPQDVGKATAMGIFQKPSQPYDESQYVQRQLQLQQGRETPTQMHRVESNDKSGPHPEDRGTNPATIAVPQAVQDARLPPTPVTDTETSKTTTLNPTRPPLSREVSIDRPSDKDHPAFRRQSALPVPLAIGAKANREPSPSRKPELSVINSQQPSPEDSPTLGPAAGLSGLVRQHLRTESVDSEVGGPDLDMSGLGSRFNLDHNGRSSVGESGSVLSPWPSSDQDWIRSGSNSPETTRASRDVDAQFKRTSDSRTLDRTSTATEEETDEFANQLADARRRVREKLTSYVESDSSRATSPLLLPTDSPSLSAQSSNPLGILKPKSSRGSLIDRSRNMGQPKGLKILGLGTAGTGTPPQPGKQSFEGGEFPSLETMKEEVSREDLARGHNVQAGTFYDDSNSAKDKDEDSSTHPGLKAFRQARRDLQRRKELETLARHQMAQTVQSQEEPLDQRGMHSARADRGPRMRTPSTERGPPPVAYRQRAPSDEHGFGSPGSARPSGERSRSGSEASAGRSNSRPPRLRTNNNMNAGPHDQLGPPNPGRPMMRSPGLPGTDIKGSPMMPPYPYPYPRGGPSPAPSPHMEQSRSAANLALHTGRLDVHSGQPSPISPMGLPSPAPYAMGPGGSPVGTPTSLGPRPRLPSASQSPALGHPNGPMPGPMRRPVDKREISEPTFVTSTSRVPTTALPHHHSQHPGHSHYPPAPQQPPPMVPGMADGARPYGGPRSRSNSRAAGPAPPVPPINPRRRREDSRTGAPYEEGEMAAPRLPYSGQANDHGAASEDEGGNRPDQRRRLRKPHPDMQGQGQRPFPGMARDNSPPYVANGPSAGRSMAASNNAGLGAPNGMI